MLAEHERQLARSLVDGFGSVKAVELLSLSPAELTHVVLGLPVDEDAAQRCRSGLAYVARLCRELDEAAPLSAGELRALGLDTVRSVGASVISNAARAMGHADSL